MSRRSSFCAYGLLSLVLAASCSSQSGGGGSPPTAPADAGGDALIPADAAGCSYPVSQGVSQPCCAERGPDACGANLFCAAFDGRTQTTCYPEHSRLSGQTCTADVQCASSACSPSGVCKAAGGEACDPGIGCGVLNGEQLVCVLVNRENRCERCVDYPAACGRDAGPVPGKCTANCATNLECQQTCPAVQNGTNCCDVAVGICFSTMTQTCP